MPNIKPIKILRSHIFFSLSLIFLGTTTVRSELYDGVAAIVGNEIILISELEEVRASLDQQPGFQNLSEGDQRKEILNRVIDDKVLLVKARQDTTIKITEKELAPRIDDHIARLAEQQGGEKKLETLLKQTNGMTLSQFRAKLLKQSMEQSLKQKLQFKYVGEAEPSHSQVLQFYEKYRDSLPSQKNNLRISHIQIAIKPSEKLEKSARAKTDSLIKLLDKGTGFADLAKEHSDDFSGKSGGDLGFTKRGTLDPDYEKAAFSLGLGEYTTAPVRSRHGYHAIKVTGKKDNEVKTSHILVKLTPGSADTNSTRALLDSLRTVVASGKKFAELARKFSEDRQTKDKGGSLGWFTKETLDPIYRSSIDTLQEGQVSQPVLIANNFHIFSLDKEEEERKLNIDEDWAQISQIAKNYLMSQKLTSYVERWRKTIHIEDKLGPLSQASSGKVDESENQIEEEGRPSQNEPPN